MSRILICVGAFEPSTIFGGPAAVASDHARALAARGHEVTVLTTNLMSLRPARRHELTEVERDGIHIHYLRAHVPYPHFSAVVVPALHSWMRRELHRFDVVHIHFGRDYLPVACAAEARRAGKPYVLQTHGMLHRSDFQHRVYDRLLTRKALRGAAVVLALQEEEARQLHAIEPNAHIERLANGIAIPVGEPPWSRDRLKPPARIVFLARLAPTKRVLDLIEAAAMLSSRGIEAHYEIIGPDGGDLQAARQRVDELGLKERFSFIGPLPREAAMLRLRDAAIHAQPSRWECYSMTTLEALAFGVPCIVTTGNELWRELRDAGAALVVEPGAEAFADGLQRVLSEPDLATSISQRGSAWLRQNCSLDAVMARLEAIYERAAASHLVQ